jgi:hypothetical protein
MSTLGRYRLSEPKTLYRVKASASHRRWSYSARSRNSGQAQADEAKHGEAAPPPLCADMIVCDESADRAREIAEKYVAAQYTLTIEHYELLGEHFAQTKGYGEHAAVADALRSAGQAAVAKNLVDICLVGTRPRLWRRWISVVKSWGTSTGRQTSTCARAIKFVDQSAMTLTISFNARKSSGLRV